MIHEPVEGISRSLCDGKQKRSVAVFIRIIDLETAEKQLRAHAIRGARRCIVHRTAPVLIERV